ncbi:imidazole glycerol phosphate synthase subunit HisF [Trueperella sp. LYQ143]|uniref:imidazole glycerol phosphate synthase subunit HisF n=1 Tax=unclassified Trueperella TaxID=2630174 RepID=UPI0039831353
MGAGIRVIPCLDTKDGRVVKGVNFADIKDVGDPVELAKRYCEMGADELGFLDISASVEGRATMREVVRRTAQVVTVPFTVGGGVRNVEDVRELMEAGASKIGINTSALLRPEVLTEIAEEFGPQAIMLSVDARRAPGCPSGFEVTINGGTQGLGRDALEWAVEAVERGAGEVLLNSMDADGMTTGYDIELLEKARKIISAPIIASGGAGCVADFVSAAQAGADAVLAASVFHFGVVTVAEVKAALRAAGFEVLGE